MQRLTLRLYLLMTSKDENNPSGQKRSFILPHNGQKRMIDDMETHSEQLKVNNGLSLFGLYVFD